MCDGFLLHCSLNAYNVIPSYHIAKCYNPERVITTDVIIEGFEDPALEGENITFSCRNGLMLIGPNSAMCMRNGEWEPDPRETNCTGIITRLSTGMMTTEASTICNLI